MFTPNQDPIGEGLTNIARAIAFLGEIQLHKTVSRKEAFNSILDAGIDALSKELAKHGKDLVQVVDVLSGAAVDQGNLSEAEAKALVEFLRKKRAS